MVAVCIRLLPGYEDFFKDQDLNLSWMLGQWLQRQEAQIENYGGVFDQLGKGLHISYWKMENETPGAFSQVVFECVKSCLKDTDELAKQAMDMIKAARPFVRASASMHYGEVTLQTIGSKDINHQTMLGRRVRLLRMYLREQCKLHVQCCAQRNFRGALGSHGTAHPYCMALTGPRKQSTVLYHLT